MTRGRTLRRPAGHLLLALLAAGLVGCATPAAAPEPTVSATAAPPAATLPDPTPLPTATLPPARSTESAVSSPTPEAPLNQLGPWLLFTAGGHGGSPAGLYAVNPDGTGLTQLAEANVLPGIVPSPQGDRAVYLASGEGAERSTRTLMMIAAPGWQPREIGVVFPPGPDAPGGDAEARALALDAVQSSAPVWSSRGTHLAFVSAAGGSSDLYVYPLFAGQAVRLSTEEGQAAHPQWSPGGRWIAYRVLDSTGAEPGQPPADALWVAAADGAVVRLLAEAAPPAGDVRAVAVGWGGPNTLQVAQKGVTTSSVCPYADIWAVDVAARGRITLHAGDFAGAAVDPLTGVALVAANAADGCTGPDGLMIYRPDLPSARIAAAAELGGAVQSVRWNESLDRFEVLVGAPGSPPGAVLWVGLDGRIQQMAAPPDLLVAPSPDGTWTALYTPQAGGDLDGLWVGRGDDLPQPVFDGGVDRVLWHPDSSGLFFLQAQSDRALWLARAPSFVPVPVTNDLQITFAVWLGGG